MRLLRRSIPSANSLFVFEAVARHLSFQKAAGELNITQPSVSYAIRQLETQLQLKLFHRLYRRIELTDEGQVLFQDISMAFDVLEASLGNLKAPTKQTVRIAVTTVFATHYLVPRLSDFEATFPNVNLDIITVDWPTVTDSKTDISIHLDITGIDSPEFWTLATEEVFPVCSETYLNKSPPLTTPSDLPVHRLLDFEDRHFKRMTWPEWMHSLGVPSMSLPKRSTQNNYSVVLQSALSGQGIALGWRHIAGVLADEGQLIRPLKETVFTGRTFYLRGRKEQKLRPVAEEVKDWLLDQTKKYRQ